MTDSSPGPGWWLASDGNWYPPHLHPDAAAHATEAVHAVDDLAQRAPSSAVSTVAPARTTESDADILAAFHITDEAAPAGARPDATPLDEIRATTGGGIDWEAVARERAAQREQRSRQAGASRRKMFALGGIVVALIAFVLVARSDRGGDDNTRTITTPSSTVASVVTSAAPTTLATPTTLAPSTTAAPTTVAAAPTTVASGTTVKSASGATAASGAGGNVSVFSLAPGSCIDQDNLTTGLVTTVKSVPCDQSHTHEVYFKTSVTPADQAYDAAKVTAFANQACTQGFEAYVGIAYEQSKYYFLHLAPSAESWNKNRDRDVVCLLLLEGQKLTTSVKGKKE